MFETDKEVLDWYEQQPRALSKEFVNSIRWDEVANYPTQSRVRSSAILHARRGELDGGLLQRASAHPGGSEPVPSQVHGPLECRRV